MKQLKPIEEVYPPQSDSYFCIYDYNPMIESLGFDIALKVDDTNYQGDSRVLFRDDLKWGILIFGWGSCSGCDSLQACQDYKEVDQLRTILFNQIKWFDNSIDCLHYVETHDWELDYSWHSAETKEFVKKVKDILRKFSIFKK